MSRATEATAKSIAFAGPMPPSHPLASRYAWWPTLGLIAALCWTAASPARAQDADEVLVRTLVMRPGERVATTRVTNGQDRRIMVQARTQAYDCHGPGDALVDTEEVVVVPPIAVIEAGASQVFRVAIRATGARPVPLSYRIAFDVGSEVFDAQPGREAAFRTLSAVELTAMADRGPVDPQLPARASGRDGFRFASYPAGCAYTAAALQIPLD